MSVVMEGNIISIIMLNTFRGDDRSAEISANVFNDFGRVTFVILGIDIKPINMVFVNVRFNRFKRRTDMSFKLIKKSGTERIS